MCSDVDVDDDADKLARGKRASCDAMKRDALRLNVLAIRSSRTDYDWTCVRATRSVSFGVVTFDPTL